MNLLNKLTIKNLKLNKKRTIVTIIGIILSVALITAVASMFMSGVESLKVYEKQKYGDYHMNFSNVPIKDIEDIKNYRGIEEMNMTKSIGYAKIGSKNESKPYAYLIGYTESSLENVTVNIIEGRFPKNDSEIVIPSHLKTNGRVSLKVGDEITLDIGVRLNEETLLTQFDPYILDEEFIVKETKKYKIVGIAERPSSIVEPFTAPGYTFITYVSNSEMIDGSVNLFIKLDSRNVKKFAKVFADIEGINPDIMELSTNQNRFYNEEEQEKIHAELSKVKYPHYDINTYLIQLEVAPVESMGGLSNVIAIVIGIIMVTSIFCIKNSFDISIVEKTKQYGMLRSIGATKKQIRKNVFYEATILGIFGITFGLLAGLLASYILVIVSNYFLADTMTAGLKLVYSFSWGSILVAIVTGIITIYLSAFRSARRASKVSPIESIRNSAEIKLKSKKIKAPKIIKKIFGIGGEISYKNLKRNKKKYRTTTISIIMSVAVFIALFSFMKLAFVEVKSEIRMQDYNITLTLYGENDFDYAVETTKFENIENYTIYREEEFITKDTKYNKEYLKQISNENMDESTTYIVALGKEQYSKYLKSLGLTYESMKNKAILFDYATVSSDANDEIYMRLFDYKVGDKIKGTSYPDKEASIEVGYVTEKKPFGFDHKSNIFLIVSDELFDSTFESLKMVIFYKTSDATKLQDDIETYMKGISCNINNSEENYQNAHNLFMLVGIFLYGFIIVISLIGVTNIFNTITTTMELRKQEFAMLRSVGMTNKEFNRMIRLEALFMGLKSLIISIPIGILLSYLIYRGLASNSSYQLPIDGILIATVAVFVLIFIIMKYSIKKINKHNTIEIIRNENI